MKKIAIISLLAVILFACGQKTQKLAHEENKPEVVLSIDEVLAKTPELADQEVVVNGTVMHVCKEGGARCFLMGSSEDVTIRIEAGEKIGAFSQEQMGTELTIVGVLKEVLTEADAHNPGAEHGEEAAGEADQETDNAHRILADNQEAAERVFFIEGMKVQEP